MNKLNDKNVNILCTMVARNGVQNMEIVCTTCLLIDRIDQFVIGELSECLEKHYNIDSYLKYAGKPIIVHIFSDLDHKVESKYLECGHIIYIQIGILDYLFGINSETSLLKILLDTKVVNYNKEKGKITKNVLFVFSEMLWSNIVLLFKLNNVILHGGNNNSRHKLTLKHFKLLEFLNLFARYDFSLLEYILIQNMKEIKKSDPYISKEIYKNISLEPPKEENIIVLKKNELYREHQQVLNKFLFYNDNLVVKIKVVEHYLKIKNEIERLESVIGNSNYLKDNETDNNIVGLTKYQQRLLKSKIKEGAQLKLNKIELIRMKEELVKLENNKIFKEMSVEIISKIGKDLQRLKNKDYKELLKYRIYPEDKGKVCVQNPSLVSNRKYHSSSLLLTSLQSKGKSENNIISFIEEQGLSFKNYNIENSERLQLKLENLWLLSYTNKLKDEKYLESKNTILIVKTIKEAYKTLNIYYTNKQIDKNFNKIEEDLNDEELIFLTYSLLLCYYNRLALTALCMTIGNYILLHIFNKRKYIDGLNKWKMEKRDKLEDENFNINLLIDMNVESTYLNFNDFKEKNGFFDQNIVKLGDFFISIFCQFPSNVFEREHSIDSYYSKTGIKLKINPLFLNEIKENLIISPTVLPMVSEPRK